MRVDRPQCPLHGLGVQASCLVFRVDDDRVWPPVGRRLHLHGDLLVRVRGFTGT
jgi:hypothetical protein